MSDDGQFCNVARACERLLLVAMASEPLEGHGRPELRSLADDAWRRAAFLLPTLGAIREPEESTTLDTLSLWRQAADTLGDHDGRQEVRRAGLCALVNAPKANPAVAGAAAGMLHGDGVWDEEALAQALRGRLLAATAGRVEGACFLSGLLRTERAACWQVSALIEVVSEALRGGDDALVLAMLPHLRLAFADLTPRECDQLAGRVARALGAAPGELTTRIVGFDEADVRLAARVDAAVRERLHAHESAERGGDESS